MFGWDTILTGWYRYRDGNTIYSSSSSFWYVTYRTEDFSPKIKDWKEIHNCYM
jgi:hypothetical protein